MLINISIRHGQLSAETQEKVTAKLQKLSRFNDRITSVNATIDLERPESPHVEIRISAERAEDFVATEQSDSLSGSVDEVVRKLEQQLRRHKEKKTGRRHINAKAQRMAGQEELEHETDEEE